MNNVFAFQAARGTKKKYPMGSIGVYTPTVGDVLEEKKGDP
jgi:hypothetical protein